MATRSIGTTTGWRPAHGAYGRGRRLDCGTDTPHGAQDREDAGGMSRVGVHNRTAGVKGPLSGRATPESEAAPTLPNSDAASEMACVGRTDQISLIYPISVTHPLPCLADPIYAASSSSRPPQPTDPRQSCSSTPLPTLASTPNRFVCICISTSGSVCGSTHSHIVTGSVSESRRLPTSCGPWPRRLRWLLAFVYVRRAVALLLLLHRE